MFDGLYMDVLDMSKTASIVIAVVLLARFLLKKAPKVFSYALWAVVLFRLLCPVSFEARVSVVPQLPETSSGYTLSDEPISFAGAGVAAYHAVGDMLNGGLGVQHIPTTEKTDDGTTRYVTTDWWSVWILFGKYIWAPGMAVMLICAAVSYRKIRKQIAVAIPLRDNIWIADHIKSPFVIGIINPKIYLPCNLGDQEQEYIILHEQHHIRRGDHIFKVLAFLALTIHWFNPLVWVAFILASRDMEMSCDEAVIRKVGSDVRADYSASLLTLATGRRIIAGTPLAFGEGDTKGRIHNLAKWKKPARWIIIVSVLLCVALGVCLITNPAEGMPLHKIEGRSQYQLDKMESVMLNSFGMETAVMDLDGVQEALDQIKVSRKPIDQSRSEDRDSSHQIILEDRFYINFSWDYGTVWIDDLVKPTCTYAVLNPTDAARMFREHSDVGFNWGITLKAENATPNGAKITMTQTGGYLPFRLMYGDDYYIQKLENGQWVNAETIGNYISDLIATTVPLNDSVSWNINWSNTFGTLEPGHYRFCKTITDHRTAGDNDDVTFYAEFEVLDETLLKTVFNKLDLPDGAALTYMGTYTNGSDALFWYFVDGSAPEHYVAVGCKQKASGQYKFEKIYDTMTYAKDIVHTVWNGEDIFLMNNTNCAAIVYMDQAGQAVQNIDMEKEKLPYVFCLDTPTNPGSCMFVDFSGEEIK